MGKKRISLLLVLLVLVSAGTALAFIERTPKFLVAKLSNTPIGCVSRIQGVVHGGSSSPVDLVLLLSTLSWGCDTLEPDNFVSGWSHIGLVKWTSSGLQFCTSETVGTGGWKMGTFEFTKRYPVPPCGPGWYKAISCSEKLGYKVPLSEPAALIGATVEDCSNILHWTWSPDWHPMCTACPSKPPT